MPTNLPNEPGAWDADFSYGYLAKLYAALKATFVPALIGDTVEALALSTPLKAPDAPRRVFVRHDIDVSLCGLCDARRRVARALGRCGDRAKRAVDVARDPLDLAHA